MSWRGSILVIWDQSKKKTPYAKLNSIVSSPTPTSSSSRRSIKLLAKRYASSWNMLRVGVRSFRRRPWRVHPVARGQASERADSAVHVCPNLPGLAGNSCQVKGKICRRIVHRDLKTANIFMNVDKVLKIGDFGISKSLDKTLMAATTMVGTPYYLSPEMVEGKHYSTKADIWALGVILYQLCSLKLPF